MTHRIRDLVALAAAVAACVAVVAAPTLARSAGPAADPRTLTGAWPHARAFDIPGAVLSGQSYEPQAIIADGVSIGTAKSADGATISLVQVTSTHIPARVRVLQAGLSSSAVSYDAFAVTRTDTYVMRNTTDSDGSGVESLWRIPRTAGDPVLMTADAGQALFQGSIDDLQVAGGMLRWVASAPEGSSLTELRSIPLAGGPIRTRMLPGQYVLSTYPMLYSGEVTGARSPKLTNSVSGKVTVVRTAQNAGTFCDPVWCMMQGSAASGANTLALCHPDGTGRRRPGDANASLITVDPALLDRFVALTEQSQAMAATPNPTVQLWLYDARTRRSVEVSGAASATFGVGGWLWWSTGDNETLTWHALDLTTLR
jgi:hypothetical protein